MVMEAKLAVSPAVRTEEDYGRWRTEKTENLLGDRKHFTEENIWQTASKQWPSLVLIVVQI